MSGFTLFKRGECPICEGASKGCRQSTVTDLIFCRDTTANPTNYIHRGEDVHSFGLWQHSEDAIAFNEQASEERHRRRREFLEAEERRRERQIAQQLSAIERDQWYRKLLDNLVLTESDRSSLIERNFTEEQITKDGYKSVGKFQKIGIGYPYNLPGILTKGFGSDQVLNVGGSGILCPIHDQNRLIVGFQVRLHDAVDGRYRWLSSTTQTNPDGASPHLNGELPLGIFEPDILQSDGSIWLTEGTGIKPSLARYRLGVPVIGAASGRFDSSPKTTKAAVEYICTKYQSKTLTFAIDAGDVVNKSGVPKRWLSQFEFFQKLGYECRIAWWGQVDKSFEDIDELKPDEYNTIRYLTFAEFEDLCFKWGSLEETEKTSNITPIDYDERVAAAQKRLHSLSYPIDLICDPSKKYLPDLVGRIPTKGLVGLKAPKGSGKSHQIKLIKDYLCGYWEEIPIIAQETPILPTEQLELLEKKPTTVTVEVFKPEPETTKIWHKGQGMRFLSINARIALGREQAIRWEFTWIEDADLDGRDEFGGERIARNVVLEEIDGIGLCWDSLNKIFSRDWSDTLVVIDELELGLNHVSTSSTCRDKRSLILHTLEHKLGECLNNRGLLLVADADLSDVSLDYLTTIAPGHPPYLISHDFKGDPWEIDFYTGKRDVVLSQIEEWLSDEHCRPIAISLDNQREAESLSMFLTKKYPRLSQEVGGLIRIDSKITQTDFGKKFVQYPNESIVGGKDRQGKEIKALLPKVLIYTPSLGVGCSIDVPYFARLFSLNFGNVEPSQARQSMARVRQPIPRTAWAKEWGASNSENEPTSYLPEEIKRRMFDSNEGLMTTMMTALCKARELADQQGINDPEDKDLLPLMIGELQAMMGIDGSWNNPHLDLYADQTARRNFSLSQFAVQLRQELIDEGHILRDCQGDGATNAGDAVTEGKKEIKRRNATATANAENISYEEAQEFRRKPTRSDQEEHSMAKAFMKHDLPGVELTPEFVLKAKYEDNGRWLSQAKLFWHIYNLDACEDKDEREWKYRLNQFSKGVVFLPDIKSDMPKVEAILKSGVLDWVKPSDLETEYSNQSPEGQAFVKNAYAHRKTIKTALNITVQRDSEPVKLANRILARIGLALTYNSFRGTKENRVRYYKLNEELATDSDRKAVWEALDQRWRERFSKTSETFSQQGQNDVQIENDFLYKTKASVHQNQPEELGQNCVVEHTTEQWKEEEILALAEELEGCEEPETLALLRQCQDIPIHAFKAASNLLPSKKREEIRQWVVSQNAA